MLNLEFFGRLRELKSTTTPSSSQRLWADAFGSEVNLLGGLQMDKPAFENAFYHKK